MGGGVGISQSVLQGKPKLSIRKMVEAEDERR